MGYVRKRQGMSILIGVVAAGGRGNTSPDRVGSAATANTGGGGGGGPTTSGFGGRGANGICIIRYLV